MLNIPYCKHCECGTIHTTSPAIKLEDISLFYSGRAAPALSNITFETPQGTRIAVLGPNGAGKSTLMQILAGFLNPQKGCVRLFGHPPDACLHQMVYVPQRSQIDWEFPITVFRLVLSGAYVRLGWLKRPNKAERHRAMEAIAAVHLSGLEDQLLGELSVGQQQRALLARALVHNADLLLLDEPFAAVDQETQKLLHQLFFQLKQTGKTIFMATHEPEFSQEHFDGLIRLSSGKLQEIRYF